MNRPEIGEEISPRMTVLDVIHRHRSTEALFKDLEKQTGHCICCEALFDPLDQVAQRYQLDLEELLANLRAMAAAEQKA